MTRWYTEKKKEHFYKEAKQIGYRARSAFKLQQIQNRFHLIPKNGIVVDLGAAPGGWSQVAKELVGNTGHCYWCGSFIDPTIRERTVSPR